MALAGSALDGAPYVLAYLGEPLPVFGKVLPVESSDALVLCDLFPLHVTHAVQMSVHRVRLEPLKRESPVVGAGLRYSAAQQRLALAVHHSTLGYNEAGHERYELQCHIEYIRAIGELRDAIMAHVVARAPAQPGEPVLVHAGQGQRARFAWVVSRVPATGLCRVRMIDGLSVEDTVCAPAQLEALASDDPLVDLAKACMAAHEQGAGTKQTWSERFGGQGDELRTSDSLLDATTALSAAIGLRRSPPRALRPRASL